VDSPGDRRLLVRSIDSNPVAAGLTATPVLCPCGSAAAYARASGPPWLERTWVGDTVRLRTGRVHDTEGYASVFGRRLSTGLGALVERRISSGARGPDPLDDLVAATPDRVLDWMRRKARLADGTRPGLAVCDPASVAAAIERGRALHGDWPTRSGRRRSDAWTQPHAGLLADLCGMTLQQVGHYLVRSESDVGKLRARHRARMLDDEDHAARARSLVLDALRACELRPDR